MSYREEESGNQDLKFTGAISGELERNLVIGVLIGFQDDCTPLVEFEENETGRAVSARSTVRLTYGDTGSEVALAFDRGDHTKPIILGRLLSEVLDRSKTVPTVKGGEQLIFAAKKEIVLDCGNASITLTHAGKIIIRGNYVVSHSTGVNRIRGGSVQIN
ncbi:MAG: hypothetical protein JO334_11545 [Verrucomicrobia bacterium]|nr:hypothetical protein [Verrucomicrobiota bacterium]